MKKKSEATQATPENACLLVKMKGDEQTYVVDLDIETSLMLVRVAASYSKGHVLSIVPFDSVVFMKRCVACKKVFTPAYDGESICLTCHNRYTSGED